MRALAGAPGVRVPDGLLRGRRRTARGVAVPRDEHRPGRVPRADPQRACHRRSCRSIPERAFGAAAMLAALHRVDPDAIGLGEREALHARRRDQALDARVRDRRRAHERALPRSREAAVRHHAARASPTRSATATTASATCSATAPRSPRSSTGRSGRCRTRASTSAWFLFFTDEAKHPMASNPGPTGMPTAQALLDAYVEESGARAGQPRVVPLPHPLQGGGRDRAAHEADGEGGRRRRCRVGARSPRSTAECIDRLRDFTPA